MTNRRLYYIAHFLIFILLIFSGCSGISAENENNLNTSNNEIQEEVVALQEKIDKLKDENKELKMILEESQATNNEIKTDYKYYLNNYYYVEDKIQSIIGYKKYIGEEPLRALPYSNAIKLNSFSSEVNVISTVRNKLGEQWALVEFLDAARGRNNYGFLKVEYIEEQRYTGEDFSQMNIPIITENFRIGDVLEKAIAELGMDYYLMKGKERGFIHYGETIGLGEKMVLGKGIDIFYNLQTHNIWLIRVDKEGYYTAEGCGVGSNAKDCINFYMSKFPIIEAIDFENKTGYWSFDVGYDYILKFKIDTETLNEKSTISTFELAPKWWSTY